MTLPNPHSIDISICIPTYNRSHLLKNCLEHLLTFTAVNFEVIIGDNASTDNTREVSNSYVEKFPVFTYHRHIENIGFARNMDSILRMAQGKYIYILSDDDIVFENALILMKYFLDETPAAASINGKYISSDKVEIGKNETYKQTPMLAFKKGNYIDLINNFVVCDGHPLMRREIFQQYCRYNTRSFCLMPLFFKLLSHGDIYYIQQPIFQHYRNSESLSTSATEHWFIDYANADLETSLSDIINDLPAGTTAKIRQNILRGIYFHAARIACNNEDYTVLWHYLRRLKAIAEIREECLVKCETSFILKVTIERICMIIKDMGITNILFQDTQLVKNIKEFIQPLLKNVTFKNLTSSSKISGNELSLLETYNANIISDFKLHKVVSIEDTINSLRLSQHPIQLKLDSENIRISFTNGTGVHLFKKESRDFKLLNMRYSG